MALGGGATVLDLSRYDPAHAGRVAPGVSPVAAVARDPGVDSTARKPYTDLAIVGDQARYSRRALLKTALGGAAGLAFGAPGRLLAAQAPAAPSPVRLADDLFVMTVPGAENVLARTGGGGPRNPPCGRP